ncbi:MAG: OmpA family protein [Gemmatimonadales bacterium]
MRKFLLALAALAVVGTPAIAQTGGTVELGGFARYNKYGNFNEAEGEISSKARNAWGWGGRLGYFFSDRWQIELDGSHNPTDLDEYITGQRSNPLEYNPFHLRLNYNIPMGERAQFIIGAGPGLTMYRKIIHGTNMNVSGLVGIRAKLFGPVHLRVDGTLDYEPSGINNEAEYGDQTDTRTHLGAQAGLSLLFGGGCNQVDSVTVSPRNTVLQPGQRQTFTATTWNCGRPLPVSSIVASGGGTLTGSEFVAGSTAGTYYVTATDAKSGMTGRSSIEVRVPPPPPPPPAPQPPPPPPAPPRAILVLQGVSFMFDSSSLTREAQDTLARVARDLITNSMVNVEVVGHTDWIGSNEYNMRLSRARAESVKNFLIARGVAADRIATAWFGEERPIATNETDAGRAQNRRVEINRTNENEDR